MKKMKMVIPKGRMFNNVVHLLNDSGIGLETNDRFYIPRVVDSEIEAKIMKPQNIAQLVELGSHDIDFVGYDWIVETGSNAAEVMDLKLDPVKVVAAVPSVYQEDDLLDNPGKKRQLRSDLFSAGYGRNSRDLKSLVGYPTCRFESGPRHSSCL